jgi:hypothetical protein
MTAPVGSFTVPEIEDEVCALPQRESVKKTAQTLKNRRAPLPVFRPSNLFMKLHQTASGKIASKLQIQMIRIVHRGSEVPYGILFSRRFPQSLVQAILGPWLNEANYRRP